MRLITIWNELAFQAAEEQLPFKIADINCKENPVICREYKIQTYPQLWVFHQSAPLHKVMGMKDGRGHLETRFPIEQFPAPKRVEEEILDADILAEFMAGRIKKLNRFRAKQLKNNKIKASL